MESFFIYILCRIKSSRRLCHINHNVLHLGIMFQDDLMGLSSDTGCLAAAKWSAFRDRIVGVDPHTSCFHASCHTKGPVDISGPNSTA